jgi:uncharacterized membrane protein YhaH (DUF805 family)
MNLIDSITVCVLDKYVTFSGRAQRSEFWWFYLFVMILFSLGVFFVGLPNQSSAFIITVAIVQLGLALPVIAVTVRRLHDTDRSGWWYFILFIPLAGVIILLTFCSLKGTEGTNRFGPDPLGQ